jgi:hypothetical protein
MMEIVPPFVAHSYAAIISLWCRCELSYAAGCGGEHEENSAFARIFVEQNYL